MSALDAPTVGRVQERSIVAQAREPEVARERPATVVDSRLEQLTPHEKLVAAAIGDACTNREAAARLCVSIKTIETHLTHIYRKLGVRSRTELAIALRP